jgi:DNA-binding XRE family transcriptional regulator
MDRIHDDVVAAPCNLSMGHGGTFGVCLKQIRHHLGTKQICLSNAIGCTAAAISLWESGARLPSKPSLRRLLAALVAGGAPSSKLTLLFGIWQSEMSRRYGLGVAAADDWHHDAIRESPPLPNR